MKDFDLIDAGVGGHGESRDGAVVVCFHGGL